MDKRTSSQPPSPRILPASQGIAQRIRSARQVCGMTQDDLARRCQVTRQTVSNWEGARTVPDALSLASIARALGTTADELLGTDAPAIRDHALQTRRELALALAIILAAQLIMLAVNAFSLAFANTTSTPAASSFAAFHLGITIVGLIWIARIVRRANLRTFRQAVAFASLASSRPGSASDRVLRFLARWWWTVWFAACAAIFAAAALTSILFVQADPAT